MWPGAGRKQNIRKSMFAMAVVWQRNSAGVLARLTLNGSHDGISLSLADTLIQSRNEQVMSQDIHAYPFLDEEKKQVPPIKCQVQCSGGNCVQLTVL